MGTIFSDRISDVPRSFIREILKVAVDKSIISFAGGLPNRELFPVEEIRAAADKVLRNEGRDVLQYSTSEGYRPLREVISLRYRSQKNLDVDPDDILIISGSQQGLDLLGKTLLNEGDHVIIEEPGYLGAIQAFAVYRARFHPIPTAEDGIDTDLLEETLQRHPVKIYYAVPNFQNPSGATYSGEVRSRVAEVISQTPTILAEDDPYGELRFLGEGQPSFGELAPDNTVLLGTFSKIVVPSFRIGWIVARGELMEKLTIAKQASDLHTNSLGQRVIYQYLMDNDLEDHILKIRDAYGGQRQAMIDAIKEYFPRGVGYTRPEGGMFLWVTLPESIAALDLFDCAIKRKVAFVPGDPFYVGRERTNTLRLNFSSVDAETIREGIRRLAEALSEAMETGTR